MLRYPNELEVDEGMAKIAVEDAKVIMDWCRKAMKGRKSFLKTILPYEALMRLIGHF